jgi:ectoine hydroxylase-related dioxygenase (phytanoyl-CoA dioxygenase family)
MAGTDYVTEYRARGYTIIRGLFDAHEIAEIAAAAEAVHADALAKGRDWRHGNLFYRIARGADGAPRVQMAQWIAWVSPVLDALRRDPRIAAVLHPLIGGDAKQIINQIHWKAPGAPGDFAWHQDSRFRKPDSAYRNLGDAYVQTGLAIDAHTFDNGCMTVVPGSHRDGTLPLDTTGDVLGTAQKDDALKVAGLDPSAVEPLLLEPGDLALWSPFLVHGSAANRTARPRRFYINGYVRAADCDRGEWTFRGGEPVPLGPEPALVHFEQLHARPEPHFVEQRH